MDKPPESGGYSFLYGTGMYIYSGQVYMSGNSNLGAGPGRYSLPSLGGAGVGNIAHNDSICQLPATDPSPIYAVSCLVSGSNVLTSQIRKYDSTNTGGIVKSDLSLANVGGLAIPISNRGGNSRGITGKMIDIPVLWQSLLGGPHAILGVQASLIQNCCNGYGLSVFDAANVPQAGGNFDVDTLLWYPHNGPNGNAPSLQRVGGAANEPYFNWRNDCTVTAFIPSGSRSLLFVACHGYGPDGGVTGTPRDGSTDSDPYRLQVTAYDLADLVDVKNGVITNPYDVEPYAWWLVTPGDDSGPLSADVNIQVAGGGHFDHNTSRLYVHEFNQETIHVWQTGGL
jgi:hypothetical protein